jgi:hypothetical protein
VLGRAYAAKAVGTIAARQVVMADDPTHKAGKGSFDPSKTRLFHSPGPQKQVPEKPRKRPPPLPASRPDWHSKTRVLPIERLLPDLAKRLPTYVSPPRAAKKPVRLVRLVSKQRVYGWAVCLVLWVSVAAASGMPSPATSNTLVGAADSPRAITIQSAVPAAERARPHAAAVEIRPRPQQPCRPRRNKRPAQPQSPSVPLPRRAYPESRPGQPWKHWPRVTRWQPLICMRRWRSKTQTISLTRVQLAS